MQNRVAQLYGGFGLVASQWNTSTGSSYRAMQFNAALKDTTKTTLPDPVSL